MDNTYETLESMERRLQRVDQVLNEEIPYSEEYERLMDIYAGLAWNIHDQRKVGDLTVRD